MIKFFFVWIDLGMGVLTIGSAVLLKSPFPAALAHGTAANEIDYCTCNAAACAHTIADWDSHSCHPWPSLDQSNFPRDFDIVAHPRRNRVFAKDPIVEAS